MYPVVYYDAGFAVIKPFGLLCVYTIAELF